MAPQPLRRLHSSLFSALLLPFLFRTHELLRHYILYRSLSLSYSGFFCFLIVGVEDYCCTLCSHSVTHTHTHARTHTHTQTHGRTSLDERSVRRRYLYLTTRKILKRQTSMLPVGFEPTIPAANGAALQLRPLDRLYRSCGY